jgi:hypothetical protein
MPPLICVAAAAFVGFRRLDQTTNQTSATWINLALNELKTGLTLRSLLAATGFLLRCGVFSLEVYGQKCPSARNNITS